jgi:hypothetical protein
VTSLFDPEQLLRSANPVDEARLLTPTDSAAAQRLFEKITGVAYQPVYRRRWRVYVTSIVAAIAVGSGVAYAIIRQPTKKLYVSCYAQASLQGVASNVPSAAGDPVATCRNAWIARRVGQGGPPPNLVACILRSGATGVFPAASSTDDVCQRLGLVAVARPSPGAPTSVPAVFAVRDRVTAALLGTCVGGRQAKDLVENELRRAGLTDWTVIITTPFTPARPCASPGFDEPGRRILIIPIPPPNQG